MLLEKEYLNHPYYILTLTVRNLPLGIASDMSPVIQWDMERVIEMIVGLALGPPFRCVLEKNIHIKRLVGFGPELNIVNS